jgi:hypothetical protein
MVRESMERAMLVFFVRDLFSKGIHALEQPAASRHDGSAMKNRLLDLEQRFLAFDGEFFPMDADGLGSPV